MPEHLDQEFLDLMNTRVKYEKLLRRWNKTGFFKTLSSKRGEEERGPLSLWQAVIDRMLLDLLGPDKELKQDSLDWFRLDNEDFLEVCFLADLPPKGVLKVVKYVCDVNGMSLDLGV